MPNLVFRPEVQRRRLAYAKHKHVMSGILKHLRRRALGRFLSDDGQPNEDVMGKLFHVIDENHDGRLSASELKALILGIRFEEIDFDRDDAVEKIMKDFDTINPDNYIDCREFVHGISKWIEEAKRSTGPCSRPFTYIENFHWVSSTVMTLAS
ncbi:hypothetical protein GH714_010232 [Hevea brasiliensis]|uniref:EF-hand domain-containing protein n=1 Tax=Hevea brasiliensis TaxID=3981 RepID=A0A6A6KCK8_HEVBR|nr:hypothetical protein GH714_010232 [Hevea brasiliensis]